MQRYEEIENGIANHDIRQLREAIGNLCFTSKDFSSGEFDEVINYVKSKGINIFDNELIGDLVSKGKSSFSRDDFADAVYELKENFCKERIEDVKKIGKAVYGNSSHSISSNVSKQKLIINLIQKVANKIRDLLQKAIVTFRQVIAKNTPFVKKYYDILIKNSDKVNDLEISWVDIDGMFLISNHFQVVADPLYEKKINDALQDSSIDNFLSDLKGYKPKKKTIKIGDPKIGGIKNLLNMFDRLRFGTTGSWKVDEWRKKMNAASNAIASKKEKASASEAQESLLCQCYYLYARAMVNVQSALLIDCKNALLKAIGTVRNVKESMINLTIEVSTYDMNKAMNEIFIIESYGITEEFDSFMESRFSLPLLY